MRIQMRLNTEAQEILIKEKKLYEEAESVSASYGWIVNRIFKRFSKVENIEDVDWEYIKKYKLNLVNEDSCNKSEYNTTFNIENSVIQMINDFQILFKDVFNAKRIHKAFVVRLVIKADYILSHNPGINIYKS